MSNIASRALTGFVAGALSHIVFQGALSVLYYQLGLLPGLLWNFAPLPPFGIPTTLNFAFWAGLWGIAYGLVEPRLTPRTGVVFGGLLFGIAAMLTRWFVVLPLKGLPIAEGFVPKALVIFTGFHLVFGIGLGLLYAALVGLRSASTVTSAAEGRA